MTRREIDDLEATYQKYAYTESGKKILRLIADYRAIAFPAFQPLKKEKGK